MERYQKVEKPREVTPIDENEIRITSQGRMRSYITYAMTLLQEKGAEEIVFKAMGRAINKTVTMVELIKRRIVGLHQLTSITSTGITDTYEPLEEGLLPLETTRHVSMITISLSKKELDTKAVGYQPPIPADQVKVFTEIEYEGEGSPNMRGRGQGGRGRGRSRPQYGNGYMGGEYEDGGYDRTHSYGRGRGRGRGRYSRGGRGRGGGGGNYNPQYDSTTQDGGYNQEAPPGRGRGRAGYNNSHYGSSPQQQDGGYHDNRGRGRGGYNNSQYDAQHDGGYYNEAPPVRGRGRGGYNNTQYDAPQDGGYSPEPYAQGRGGRGRGGAGYNNNQYDAPQDGGRGRGGRFRGPPRGRGGRGGGGNYRSNNNGQMTHSADA